MSGSGGNTVGKRSYGQRKLHQSDLPKLIRRGWTTDMIAEEFCLSIGQVQLDFRKVIQQFHAERSEDTKEAISIKLQEIAEVKREAWSAWERSTQEQTVIKEETFTNPSGYTSLKYSTEKRKPVGDPRFLALVQECFKAERELQGLDAPKGISVTGHLVNWDVLAKGIPLAGPVPDDVEDEITRAMLALGTKSREEDPRTIVVPPSPTPVPPRSECDPVPTPAPTPSRTRTGASRAGAIDVSGESGIESPPAKREANAPPTPKKRGRPKGSAKREANATSSKPRHDATTLDELEGDDS